MRKWSRGLAMWMAFIFFMTAAAGCGRKELDAKAAVDAYLRAQTRGDLEDYANLLGENTKDMQEDYNENIDEMAEVVVDAGIPGIAAGDELSQAVRELLATAKYEVVGSSQDEDGNYIVDVDVYPSDVFSLFSDKAMEWAMSAQDTSGMGSAFIQALRDAIREQNYGEAGTYQIHITYDEESEKYEFDEKDTREVFEAFFFSEGTQGQMAAPTGTVYENPYFNWTKTEWDAASEDEKNQCCLAVAQEIQGFTDEQMAVIDVGEGSVQDALWQMKEGIDLSFEKGANLSIGDYVEIIKQQMAGQ